MNDTIAKRLGPNDPRPGNKPAYIETRCDTCGTMLVLGGALPSNVVDHDEWHCPKCFITYLDWPKDELDELNQQAEEREAEDRVRRLINQRIMPSGKN